MPEPPAPPAPPASPNTFVATVVLDEHATARIGVPIDGQVTVVRASVADQVHTHDVLAVIRPSASVTAPRQPDGGIQDFEVRAPRDGAVIEVGVAPGAELVRDPRRTMFVLSDLSHLTVEASVPETRIPMVRPGSTVAIRFAALPDRAFMGRVSRVNPTLDPQTHMGIISVALENMDRTISPGMSGTVQVEGMH